ncbi:hypothetical protein [Klebsiella pasteurii]|uniref:hypothetical protein n=1 Tax=Klebsiella pasteurii TaxID=2587529 RepID=UPI00115BE8C2|nr:hypothetical protein [Klebsiella pasteurii]VUS84131.1 hypothetical protein SB6416_05327 [Klebsiella pasteurii]VUS87591.1 hypothetical protein SB6424_05448 [Klebsiella pasteurii]
MRELNKDDIQKVAGAQDDSSFSVGVVQGAIGSAAAAIGGLVGGGGGALVGAAVGSGLASALGGPIHNTVSHNIWKANRYGLGFGWGG